jgi:hypothetical protein
LSTVQRLLNHTEMLIMTGSRLWTVASHCQGGDQLLGSTLVRRSEGASSIAGHRRSSESVTGSELCWLTDSTTVLCQPTGTHCMSHSQLYCANQQAHTPCHNCTAPTNRHTLHVTCHNCTVPTNRHTPCHMSQLYCANQQAHTPCHVTTVLCQPTGTHSMSHVTTVLCQPTGTHSMSHVTTVLCQPTGTHTMSHVTTVLCQATGTHSACHSPTTDTPFS